MVFEQMRVAAARARDAGREARIRHRDDFAFVHINKTGGSSVEKALKLPRDHRTARQWKSDLGEAEWERRFTFTFVRNPWEKVLSQYAFQLQRENKDLMASGIDFNTWVRKAYGERDPRYHKGRMYMPQVDWIGDESGNLLVDYVGRFERFAADFEVVCDRIGRQASLPHLKSSRHGGYRDAYQAETAEIVRTWFARDIEQFGYEF